MFSWSTSCPSPVAQISERRPGVQQWRTSGVAAAVRPGYQHRMLNVLKHGDPTDRPVLLIAHGLYGSARNWGMIAKNLASDRQVWAVDMRNHGLSPWHDSHTYEDMAGDLATMIEAAGAPCDLLGHSMGGKASMMLALTRPELVNRLVVADIAPVSYSHSQLQYIDAMKSIDLDQIAKRSDAREQLETVVDDPTLVSFFTQSIDIKSKKWRLNLDVLADEMPEIMAFPDIEGTFGGATLFLSGAQSDYVKRDDRDHIKSLFPKAKFIKIPGAGHWLHAEKPREFEAAVAAWLK